MTLNAGSNVRTGKKRCLDPKRQTGGDAHDSWISTDANCPRFMPSRPNWNRKFIKL